jgi:hypothetical protein
MAILFYARGTHETFPHVKDIVDKFMERTWDEHSEVGWLEIHNTQIESCDTPWDHPRLVSTLDNNERPDPEHYETQSWSYIDQVMYKAFTGNERWMNDVHNTAPNKWFPKVKGDVLVYRTCLCNHDGCAYKCEVDMDIERISKLVNEKVHTQPGW